MSLLPLVVLPAGLAVAGAASGGTPNTAPPPNNQYPGGAIKGGAGAAPGASVTDLVSSGGKVPIGGGKTAIRRSFGERIAGAASQVAIDDTTGLPYVAPSSVSGYIDAALQEKLDTINSYGQAAYDNMSDDAKRAGAAAMNDALDLDPPLKGDESWDEIAQVAGAAAGTAACAATGLGAAAAPLCAMAGAYLGTKLEELISKNVDEIKDWFSGKWADIEGWVKGLGEDVGDAAQAAIDYVGGWF